MDGFGGNDTLLGEGGHDRLDGGNEDDSLIGGAGPGFFVDRTIYQVRINDLQDEGRSTQRSIGVHTLAEIEFRATSRVSVFTGLRTELRNLRFPGSISGYPTAGARFAF